jgi:5-methylcytosine-specific restriction endonuclease McrA
MAHNRKDISKQIINSWKIVSYSHTKGKIAYYNCVCLECNKHLKVDGRNIRSGRSKSCFKCSNKRSAKASKGIKLKKQNTQVKYSTEDSKYAYLMNRYKKGARRNNKPFNLSLEQFKQLIKGNCQYCKSTPNTTVNILKNMSLSEERVKKYGEITYNGIDRVDSSKGYETDNVVTCCQTCNRMKLDHSVDKFKEHILKIAKNIDNF